jgi:hypothetical protein
MRRFDANPFFLFYFPLDISRHKIHFKNKPFYQELTPFWGRKQRGEVWKMYANQR